MSSSAQALTLSPPCQRGHDGLHDDANRGQPRRDAGLAQYLRMVDLVDRRRQGRQSIARFVQRAVTRSCGTNMLMPPTIWITAVIALIGLRHRNNHSCLTTWAMPAPVKAVPSRIRALRVESGAVMVFSVVEVVSRW